MSEGRLVPLSTRNISIQRWVQDTAAAQASDGLSCSVPSWPRNAPRTVTDEGQYLPNSSPQGSVLVCKRPVTEISSNLPSHLAKDPLQDTYSECEPNGWLKASQNARAPFPENLTTPASMSPPSSALWPAHTYGSAVSRRGNNALALLSSTGKEECEPDADDQADSVSSSHSTVAPSAPILPRRVTEASSHSDDPRQEMELQRLRASYSPSACSRVTYQSNLWDDGISVYHPYEDIMMRRRSEPAYMLEPGHVRESMREQHFARQQVIVQQRKTTQISRPEAIRTPSQDARRSEGTLLRRASENLARSSRSAVGFLFGVKEEDMEITMPDGWTHNRDYLPSSAYAQELRTDSESISSQ